MKYPWPSFGNMNDAIESLSKALGQSASEIAAALDRTAGHLGAGDGADDGLEEVEPKHALADIGGLLKDQLAEFDQIVEMHRRPDPFTRLGARLPAGILVAGPTGVGKTMLAHALASELGKKVVRVDLPALAAAGEGRGLARLKAAFERADLLERCMLLLDDIDAIAAGRNAGRGAASSDPHGTVAELMRLMRERRNPGVLAVATTGRIDLVESSLIRPGFFDRLLLLDLPTTPEQRLDILEKLARKGGFRVEAGLLPYLCQLPMARGLAGADLGDVLSRAAAHAGSDGAEAIGRDHVDRALPQVRQIVFRRTQNDSEGAFQRALCQAAEDTPVIPELAYVGGLEKAREELSILLAYIRDPRPFRDGGCDMPVGLLLAGRPGVGKTHLARHLAAHAKIPFLHVDGSAFIEMYVGVGAARVRDLFRLARRQAPAVIFIDEIDALAGQRNAKDNSEYYHTAAQLLAEIDGFSKNPDRRVVVIGATSKPEAIDPALLRPGRLHPTIRIGRPNEEELVSIFEAHLGQNHEVGRAELTELARAHQGRTGAFAHQLVNRARVIAVQEGRRGRVCPKDLARATQQIARLEQDSDERASGS